MKEIEALINAMPLLDKRGRVSLRKQVADCIEGKSDMPERPDNPDWQRLRRLAMQKRYERKKAGETWTEKDQAFYNQAGGGKPSVIIPSRWKTW